MSDHFPSRLAESGEALPSGDADAPDAIGTPMRVVVVPSAIGMVSFGLLFGAATGLIPWLLFLVVTAGLTGAVVKFF